MEKLWLLILLIFNACNEPTKLKFEHEEEPDSTRQWLIPMDSIYSTPI